MSQGLHPVEQRRGLVLGLPAPSCCTGESQKRLSEAWGREAPLGLAHEFDADAVRPVGGHKRALGGLPVEHRGRGRADEVKPRPLAGPVAVCRLVERGRPARGATVRKPESRGRNGPTRACPRGAPERRRSGARSPRRSQNTRRQHRARRATRSDPSESRAGEPRQATGPRRAGRPAPRPTARRPLARSTAPSAQRTGRRPSREQPSLLGGLFFRPAPSCCYLSPDVL